MKIDFELVTDVTLDGVEMNDFPDFCDAFIVSAYYDGKPMSEEMLNKINKEHFDFVQESVHEDLDKQELTPAFKNSKAKQKELYEMHLTAYDNVLASKNLNQAFQIIEYFMNDLEEYLAFGNIDEDLKDMIEYALNKTTDMLSDYLKDKEFSLEQVHNQFETIGHDIAGASHSSEQ